MNDLLRSLDHGNIFVLTLLDLSAAFDTIDHTILLHRLDQVFGIHDTALHWFSSYLTNRTQTVTVNNCSSAPEIISCGVPLGSVLAPVRFVLYTAPLSNVMDSHSVLHHSSADDTQLQKSAPPQQVDELIQSMQQCVHDVKSWKTHNKLKLNDDKTEALIISAPRISNSIPRPDSFTVGNSTVRFSQSARYLGVTLDVHLTMTAHVVKLIRIANFELSRINSTQHYLSVQATKTLFSAFVLSRLDYCNSLLSGCPQYLYKQNSKGSEQCSPPHLESS